MTGAERQAKYSRTSKGRAAIQRSRTKVAVDGRPRKSENMSARRERCRRWRNEQVVAACSRNKRLTVGATRVVVLSDIHLPFEDGAALASALNYTREFKPDLIVLNGDVLDCYALSSYIKDPAQAWATVHVERERAVTLQQACLAITPNVIYLGGNHENRWDKAIAHELEHPSPRGRAVMEVLAEGPVNPQAAFERFFVQAGVTWKPYGWRVELAQGNLVITHGFRLSSHSAYSARMHYDRMGVSVIDRKSVV